MAQRVRDAVPDEAPPLDPDAVRRNYRRARALRRARIQRRREARRASVRFWLSAVLLLSGSVALGIVFWQQVQKLFGL